MRWFFLALSLLLAVPAAAWHPEDTGGDPSWRGAKSIQPARAAKPGLPEPWSMRHAFEKAQEKPVLLAFVPGGNRRGGGELAAGSGKDWWSHEDCVAGYPLLASPSRGDDVCDAADQDNSQDIGTETGTPTYSSADLPSGFPGTAVALVTDGVAEENIADAANDSAFHLTTLSTVCWFKDHDGEETGGAHFFGQFEFDGTPANDGWSMLRQASGSSDNFRMSWMNSSITATTPTITEDVWYSVIFSKGSNPARLYVDGVDQGNNSLFGTPAGTDQVLTIGNADGETGDIKTTNCTYLEVAVSATEVCEICSFGIDNDLTTNERVGSCNSCTLP